MQQTKEGLIIPNFEKNWQQEASEAVFPSMFLSRSLNIKNLLPESAKHFEVLPYDLFCPSVYEELNRRICTKCGIYFASIVMLNKHKHIHKEQTIAKLRPVRIVVRRQQEIMASFKNDFTEWVNPEYLDLDGLEAEITEEAEEEMAVVNYDKYFENVWQSDLT